MTSIEMTHIESPAKKRIALVAHDNMKGEMLGWAKEHEEALKQHVLIATGSTGKLIADNTGLTLERMRSGPIDGETAILFRTSLRQAIRTRKSGHPTYRSRTPSARTQRRYSDRHVGCAQRDTTCAGTFTPMIGLRLSATAAGAAKRRRTPGRQTLRKNVPISGTARPYQPPSVHVNRAHRTGVAEKPARPARETREC